MGERWISGLPLDGYRALKAQLRRKKTGVLAPTCYVFNVFNVAPLPFCAIILRHQEAQN
jgi:hypothetical protein